jgi:hypothetical protein
MAKHITPRRALLAGAGDNCRCRGACSRASAGC